jgi:hypothetical protein
MVTIAYIRDSDVITDAMLASYVAAQQIQITRDFAPVWGIDATCVVVPPGGAIPVDAWQVWLKDHTDQDGSLGYHDDKGNPISYVFVADDLTDNISWTVTCSHETLEMLGDPTINQVIDTGGLEYAREVADTCEDDSLAYLINGHLMTAFATPAWFDPNGKAPFTFPVVPTITAPFQLAAGGYIGVRSLPDGQWQQRFAEAAPASPRQSKRPTSRTMRRFNAS